jgi:periplasmic divalent cation tolerance protein
MYCIILTTFKHISFAKDIAHALIDKKLAACVSLSRDESIYDWKNKRVCVKEIKMEIKTIDKHYERIQQYLVSHHEFTHPQIIKIPITDGTHEYLNWVKQSVR